MRISITEFKSFIDQEKGGLTFFEGLNDIPFEIKRVYYIYNVPAGENRGYHAHKHLKQMLFCPFGKINIVLDDGEMKEEILLNEPSKGLIIHEGIWRHMDFLEENSVLCVVASEYYDECDYIRDYGEFIGLAKGGYWK